MKPTGLSKKSRINATATMLAILAGQWAAAAATQSPANTSVTSSTSDTEELQEVTVTAQHFKLDWAQRNELIQKAATFVFGIADVPNFGDWPPIWADPVCPLVTGLRREQDEFVLSRVSEIGRAAGARLGGEKCHHPNLYIFVTDNPKELLRTMESRRYLVIFGNATPSSVEQFINRPAPVKVWHNTYGGAFFGNVNVVVDGTRLDGVSERQFADYVGMVSLAEIKSSVHYGEAKTILRLFDGPPEAAPEGLSDWDQEFLKIVYHREPTLANKRANTALRMVRELAP
ncbi:MAG TPA: hypothetical protein VIY68_13140 [Steroidobacteraceae bacterium]